MTRAHVIVTGMVQGVSFRAYTQQQAQRLGLSGWVKNLPDGRVEAIFEGSEDVIKRMISWCKNGSPAARVDNVEVKWERARGEFDKFEIRK